MKVGDIVCMRTIKPRIDDANGKLLREWTYRAPDGETFVLLLLGTTKRGTERDVDPNEILEELGWKLNAESVPAEPCERCDGKGEYGTLRLIDGAWQAVVRPCRSCRASVVAPEPENADAKD